MPVAGFIKSGSIPFAIIILGISHITTQIAVIREFINIFSGNEIVLGIIISLWLLLSEIGAWLGRFLENPRWHMPLFHIIIYPVAFLPIVIILLIRFLSNQMLIRGELPGIGILIPWTSMLLISYCIHTGMLLTLASSVLESPGKESSGMGREYFLDNVGDIMGGILFTFILSRYLDNLTVLYVPALLCLFAFLALTSLRTAQGLFFYLLGMAELVALIVVSFFIRLGDFSLTWLYPEQIIVTHSESPYGRLVVTRTGDQISFFENGELLFSTPHTFANKELVHFALPQRKDAGNILLVSGGMAGVIDEIMKYP